MFQHAWSYYFWLHTHLTCFEKPDWVTTIFHCCIYCRYVLCVVAVLCTAFSLQPLQYTTICYNTVLFMWTIHPQMNTNHLSSLHVCSVQILVASRCNTAYPLNVTSRSFYTRMSISGYVCSSSALFGPLPNLSPSHPWSGEASLSARLTYTLSNLRSSAVVSCRHVPQSADSSSLTVQITEFR